MTFPVFVTVTYNVTYIPKGKKKERDSEKRELEELVNPKKQTEKRGMGGERHGPGLRRKGGGGVTQ